MKRWLIHWTFIAAEVLPEIQSRGTSQVYICYRFNSHHRRQDEDEADPLDAFMAAEVLPEVTAAQEAERAAKEKERLEKAAQRAVHTSVSCCSPRV